MDVCGGPSSDGREFLAEFAQTRILRWSQLFLNEFAKAYAQAGKQIIDLGRCARTRKFLGVNAIMHQFGLAD